MFIISKIIGFFLHPFVWVVLLLIATWITWNPARKKTLLRLSIFVFIFFSNGYIPKNIWFRYQWPYDEMKPGEKYVAGILLGGFVSYDEVKNQSFFNQRSDRFIQAARLYKQGYISKIIMTGGNALFVREKEYNEADFVVNNLIDLGIPAADIFAEKKAKNTIENSVYSEKILDSAHIPGPYVLITSAIHMPRAVKIFTRTGIKVRPYPCDFQVLASDTWFTWQSILPSSAAFEMWNILLREFVGTISLRFTQR
jgi:uncharacterized SAM-binding protein YcdF (DUF218 family)